MNYLTVKNVAKFYGERLLFEDISFFIDKGQKVALIARNGSGKSTLLKIIQGLEPPEEGEVEFARDITIGFLNQEPVFDDNHSVYDAVLSAKQPLLQACLNYELALEGDGNLNQAMEEMERLNAWDYETRVKQILSKFKIGNLEQKVGKLSGGQKKRLALSILILQEPNFLILDEPTNHLDMDMIEWLEDYLGTSQMTLFMVTHDRYFLENVCNEILEMEDGTIYRHRGSYSQYLENKVLREDNIQANASKAKNLMRKELDWIRRQPKARGTKSKARVDAFDDLKIQAGQKVNTDKVHLEMRMNRLGSKIVEWHNVSKSFGSKKIIDKFSYKFSKGERIGIVGNNGTGKSTFLNIMTGGEKYDSGNLVLGETVVFGYYTQKGLQLKSDKRVIEVVKDIAEYFPVKGGSLSASQMLERFLFPPNQQFQYVSTLSGGERRKLFLLTVLMKNPNFLILDEPTNDLDIMTLQVLEEFLIEFPGCLILVSHDRYFLDKLTDHLFIFKGEGEIQDFNGNYREYRLYVKELEREKHKQKIEKPIVKDDRSKNGNNSKRKMSYKEKREFEQLEKDIEVLETEKEEITAKMSSGNLEHQDLLNFSQRMEVIINDLDEKEMRWLELSELE